MDNKNFETHFKLIKKYTKFCARCGKHFDMSKTSHLRIPFCEDCRGGLITNEFGTVEKVKDFGQGNQNEST